MRGLYTERDGVCEIGREREGGGGDLEYILRLGVCV